MASQQIDTILEDLSITSKILGINISGLKTIAVYGDMNGLIYERLQMEPPADTDFLAGFDAICTQADKLLKICRAQGLSSPEVISLAVSGPVDLHRGILMSPPDLPRWDEAPLKGRLGVRYNLPVFIEQRSNASALAEMHFGAGIGVEDQIFLDLEPVVSIGIIQDGSIYHGSNDAAGEIGRMRVAKIGPAGLGESGSLTGFASGLGMSELASMRYPEHWPAPPGPYELVQAVNAGKQEALQVIEEAADYLGKALLWLIFALDPELVVFGHPGDVLGESLLTPLRESVLRYGGAEARLLPRLALSKLAAKLDDTAALMAVIDAFRKRRKG
jgi:glucokinase